MVEVVGTAPTSAMVITKFVYRRSWKTNIINIKVITTDSITIMKLTKEQQEEIKNQQSQSNQTKRVTAPELRSSNSFCLIALRLLIFYFFLLFFS